MSNRSLEDIQRRLSNTSTQINLLWEHYTHEWKTLNFGKSVLSRTWDTCSSCGFTVLENQAAIAMIWPELSARGRRFFLRLHVGCARDFTVQHIKTNSADDDFRKAVLLTFINSDLGDFSHKTLSRLDHLLPSKYNPEYPADSGLIKNSTEHLYGRPTNFFTSLPAQASAYPFSLSTRHTPSGDYDESPHPQDAIRKEGFSIQEERFPGCSSQQQISTRYLPQHKSSLPLDPKARAFRPRALAASARAGKPHCSDSREPSNATAILDSTRQDISEPTTHKSAFKDVSHLWPQPTDPLSSQPSNDIWRDSIPQQAEPSSVSTAEADQNGARRSRFDPFFKETGGSS